MGKRKLYLDEGNEGWPEDARIAFNAIREAGPDEFLAKCLTLNPNKKKRSLWMFFARFFPEIPFAEFGEIHKRILEQRGSESDSSPHTSDGLSEIG